MITDLFGNVLLEIGNAIGLPNLEADEANRCAVNFKKYDIAVQFEMDPTGEYLVVASNLGEIPPGRYREIIFTEALRYNGLLNRVGAFGYNKRKEDLILFSMIEIQDLTGAKVAAILPEFLEKAALWKDAIAKGETPVVASTGKGGGGLFGLMH